MITTGIFIIGGALLGLAAAYLIIGAIELIWEILAIILGGIMDLFSD